MKAFRYEAAETMTPTYLIEIVKAQRPAREATAPAARVKRGGSFVWLASEIETLAELWADGTPDQEIATHLNRSIIAIRVKATEEGFKRPQHWRRIMRGKEGKGHDGLPWSEADIAELKRLREDGMMAYEIAETMKRTENAVLCQLYIHKMHFPKGKKRRPRVSPAVLAYRARQAGEASAARAAGRRQWEDRRVDPSPEHKLAALYRGRRYEDEPRACKPERPWRAPLVLNHSAIGCAAEMCAGR